MTLKECYEIMKGDYDDAISKFRTDDKVKKNLDKFVGDTSFAQLEKAIEGGNAEEALKATQNFKLACKNVALSGLAYSVSNLSDAIKKGALSEEAEQLFKKVKKEYSLTKACIQML